VGRTICLPPVCGDGSARGRRWESFEGNVQKMINDRTAEQCLTDCETDAPSSRKSTARSLITASA